MSVDVGTIYGSVEIRTEPTAAGAAGVIQIVTQMASQGEAAAQAAGNQISAGLGQGIASMAGVVASTATQVTGDINALGAQGGSLATAAGHEITAGLEQGLAGISAAAQSEVAGVVGDINALGSQGGSEATSSGHAITSSFGQAVSGIAGEMDSAAGGIVGKLKEFATSGAGAGAIAGAAIGAALVGALSKAMDFQESKAKLQAQLGATAQDSERYGKLAGDLFANNYAEGIDDANDTLRGVVRNIANTVDASDAELSRFAANASNLVTVTGEEAGRITQVIGRLLKTGLAESGTEAFDMLTAAAQKTSGELQGDLLDIIDEYAQNFEALGISGEDALGLIVTASEDGAIAMDKVGDAIKEFSLLATDMSTNSVAAYDTLGLSAETMANKILAGGDTARGAFQEIVTGLQGIKDPATQANTAIALFGTPLEDLGVNKIPAFLTALASGGEGLGDFAGKAAELDSVVGGTAKATLSSFANKLEMAATAIGEKLLPHIEPLIDMLVDLADGFAAVVDAAGPLWDLLGKGADFAGWLAESVGGVIEGIGAMKKIMTEGADGIEDYNTALGGNTFEMAGLITELEKGGGRSKSFGDATKEAAVNVSDLEPRLRAAGVAAEFAAIGAEKAKTENEGLARATADAVPAVSDLEQMMGDLNDTASEITGTIEGVTASINEMLGINVSAEDAAQNLNDAMRDGAQAFKDATKATDGNVESLLTSEEAYQKTGIAIDTSTEAGSKWKDSLDEQRAAADESIGTTLALGLQNGDLQTAFGGARDAADRARAMFIENNKGMAGGSVAAGLLADKLGIVEGVKLTDKELKVLSQGIPGVETDLRELDGMTLANKTIGVTVDSAAAWAEMDRLTQTKWAQVVVSTITGGASNVGGASANPRGFTGGAVDVLMGFDGGGMVPGVTPSDRTFDNLTVTGPGGKNFGIQSGEFIVNSQSTRENYQLLEAINAGKNIQMPSAQPVVNRHSYTFPITVLQRLTPQELVRVQKESEFISGQNR